MGGHFSVGGGYFLLGGGTFWGTFAVLGDNFGGHSLSGGQFWGKFVVRGDNFDAKGSWGTFYEKLLSLNMARLRMRSRPPPPMVG